MYRQSESCIVDLFFPFSFEIMQTTSARTATNPLALSLLCLVQVSDNPSWQQKQQQQQQEDDEDEDEEDWQLDGADDFNDVCDLESKVMQETGCKVTSNISTAE